MLADAQRANPNNPTVLSLYAFANITRGDLLAGRAAYLRALEIAPAALDNYELLVGVALSHLFAGEFEAAIDWSLRSLAANSDWLGTYWALGAAYGELGRLDEGRAIVARLLAKAPGMRLAHMERLGHRQGDRSAVITEGLRQAGLPS
jgi:tetratricopeptide (TPR) repeat protein